MTVTPLNHSPTIKHHPVIAIAPYADMTLTLGGVKLHLEWEAEVLYLEVSPFHSTKALRSALLSLDALGLEMMPSDECPPEEICDGGTRIWLAETFDLGHSLALTWPTLDEDYEHE